MNYVDAKSFLFDQIPIRQQVLLPPVLKRAYASAKLVMASDPMFQVQSAQDHQGRLISWAIDFAIEGLIKSGEWKVDYRWREYGLLNKQRQVITPTGHYLEILLPYARCTVSQVADPAKQPRNVKFRENARLINGPFLKGLELPNAEITGVPSIILSHGHQDLSFLQFGVPDALHHRRYVYRTENLLLLPHAVANDTAAVENTAFDDDLMTLKEGIDKWRKDHAR